MYQSGKIYTKLIQNITNGDKIHQIDLKVRTWLKNIPLFSIPRPTKINQN
jgi:hypothetical protein